MRVTAEGVFRNRLMCASNIEGARTQTVLARQDYLKTNQDAIIAQLSAVEVKLDQIIAGEKWLEPTYATARGRLNYSGALRWGGPSSRYFGRKKPIWFRRLSSFFRELV